MTKQGNECSARSGIPHIPKPPLNLSEQEIKRACGRRRRGFPVVDPNSEKHYHAGAFFGYPPSDSMTEVSSFASALPVVEQCRDVHQSDNIACQGSRSEQIGASEEWIECYDEEIKSNYYVHSKSGEASWTQPS